MIGMGVWLEAFGECKKSVFSLMFMENMYRSTATLRIVLKNSTLEKRKTWNPMKNVSSFRVKKKRQKYYIVVWAVLFSLAKGGCFLFAKQY